MTSKAECLPLGTYAVGAAAHTPAARAYCSQVFGAACVVENTHPLIDGSVTFSKTVFKLEGLLPGLDLWLAPDVCTH